MVADYFDHFSQPFRVFVLVIKLIDETEKIKQDKISNSIKVTPSIKEVCENAVLRASDRLQREATIAVKNGENFKN